MLHFLYTLQLPVSYYSMQSPLQSVFVLPDNIPNLTASSA